MHRVKLEAVLAEEKGSIELMVSVIKECECDGNLRPKQPEKAYVFNLATRVKHIAGR